MLKIVLVLLLILTLVNFPKLVYSGDSVKVSDLKSKVEQNPSDPGTISYLISRLFEKVSEKILFMEDSKVNFSKKILNKRFSELAYLAEKKDTEELQKSSERFSYQAGILAELVKDQPSTEKEKVISLFNSYKDDLNKIKHNYEQDSGYWILMLHDINTLSILTARLE